MSEGSALERELEARERLAQGEFEAALQLFDDLRQEAYQPALAPWVELSCLLGYHHDWSDHRYPVLTAQLAARHGRIEQAEALLSRDLVRRHRDSDWERWQLAPSLLGLAWCQTVSGRPWRGEHFCRRATARLLEAHPDSSPLNLQATLANLEIDLSFGDWSTARARLESARERFGGFLRAAARLADYEALLLEGLGQTQAAARAALQAAQLDGQVFGQDSPEKLGSRALAAVLAGEDWQTDQPGLALEIAEGLLREGRLEAAESHLERFLEEGRAAYLMSLLRLAQGHAEEALSWAQKGWEHLGSQPAPWTISQGWGLNQSVGLLHWPLMRLRRRLGEEALDAVALAAQRAKVERALGRQDSAAEWVNTRFGGTDFGRSRTVRLELELRAQARRLIELRLHTARGLVSSSEPEEGEGILLVLHQGGAVNQSGLLDLELGPQESFTLFAGDEQLVSRGRAAYLVQALFSEGPELRIWTSH